MTSESTRRGKREVAVFTALLLLLTALVLFLTDGGVLFTRPFWVDEWLAVFVANRSSPFAVVGDLTAGADGGSPLLHLTFWTLRRLGVGLDPWLVRAVSLSTVLGALVVVFAVLRRRYPFGAASAAGLAIGAHQLVVAHSYEGRFYGPWMLCAALVAFGLTKRQEASFGRGPLPASGHEPAPGASAPSSRLRGSAVALAIAAFLLCGIHPYGIVSLGLLLLGAMAAYGRQWRMGLRDAAPALAGLFALALLVPIALGQRDSYSVPTWLPDFAPRQLTNLSWEFWRGGVPFLAFAVLLVGAAVRVLRRDRLALETLRVPLRDAGVLALLALALMPVALATISVLGQPSMLPRYAIVTTLAWAPLVAMACLTGGRWATRVMCLVLSWFWLGAYVRETNTQLAFERTVDQARHVYDQARRTGLPVVVQSLHVLYPVIGPAPNQSPALFLTLPDSTFRSLWVDSTHVGQANRGLVLERDLARVHSARWGFPRLATPGTLDSADRFLLMAPESRRPAGFASFEDFAGKVFPNHRMKRLIRDLSLMERTATRASSK